MSTVSSLSLPGTTPIALTPALDPAREKAELAKAAKQFEAIFVRQLIGSMRQAGPGDELTGSSAVDQFQEMADARTADAMAEQGGLGIAQMLLSQLDRQIDAKAAAAATATGARDKGA